ncbi:putative transposase Ptta/En/Spm plant [Arabidopsis suecica]|uniref:Putative transposase Ptta/En/Spm plant n=1 Tax=Arabidopsis suecica TaxID=45249 RepID=A0A8T2BUK3_ARASU|nr:putative transposase Ptta/En/Spm plant [Arabidopsis suecica]
MEDTNAFWLPGGWKICWFDCHRRFLPVNHSLRKDKTHFLKGKGVKDYPPQSLTGEHVLYERIRSVEPLMTSDCGGNGHEKKVDGYGQWHKESILWQLPYWVDLTLRHNLDVMHIEKNVLDNIIYTVMNMKDRSKDTVRSRINVSRFCDQPELHVDDQGKAPFPIWRLSAKAKKNLLEWVKSEVKFPDGYVADLASCANIKAGKFSGMKSHDNHVFMERLLPFVFAELLPRNVAEMQLFWKTADAIERSENASQCINSDHGGLGVHKHLAGQKSFIQVYQEMEEDLGLLVSLGEVFMRTHTRADGSFVDQKSEQVAEAYKKTVEERFAELEEDGQDTSEISSEHSTHPRELSIDEMNDIFLKLNDQGNPYGLESLVETLHKGKRKESYTSSSSTVTIVELQDQLRRNISDQDAENARCDAEHLKSQARIASLEKLILFMKDKDPDLATFMSSSPLLEPELIIPPITTTVILPDTTAAAIQPAGLTPGTTPTSPLSNTASNH